jgi:hypothetical protein
MPPEDLKEETPLSTSMNPSVEEGTDASFEGSGAEPASPYRNLFFPLIVVPATIVVVVLLVYTLVGAITGEEATVDENLHRVLHGGSNERTQAAYALVAQLAENDRARIGGDELPWEVSEALAPKLSDALAGLGEDEVQLQYVLSSALLHLDDPAGIEGLRGILALGEEADPEGKLKFHALVSLGSRGSSETFGDVSAFLESEDQGLRSLAAGYLRFFPEELAVPALKGSLGDLDLAVRLNAAISLSWFGDPAGATLLRDGAQRDIYEAEKARNSRDYARNDVVRENRVRALEGLVRLARAEDRALLEELAEGDEDLEVREAAMRGLRSEN